MVKGDDYVEKGLANYDAQVLRLQRLPKLLCKCDLERMID